MKIKTSRRKAWEQDGYKCIAITQTVEHNVNHEVQVKLTDFGMDVWRQSELETYSDRWRNRQVTKSDHAAFEECFNQKVARHHVGDGWYEFQTYELWSLFGRHCFNGAVNIPFETVVRYVEKGVKIIEPPSA